MLHLQANTVGDPALSERLMEASTRISAVGRAYNRLAYNADYENIDLVAYLREVIGDLETAVAPCKIQLDAPKEIQFAADRAILLALIINELVLNAGRHAYPDCPDGLIRLQLVLMDRAVSISVSDDGVGLPTDFNPALTKRLGTRDCRHSLHACRSVARRGCQLNFAIVTIAPGAAFGARLFIAFAMRFSFHKCEPW
jgi:two-component sensor histidine kinase